MRFEDRGVLALTAFAATAFILSLALTIGTAGAQDKTYVMKITLPTLHDTVHQVALNWAAAVEKDSGGRIKAEVYPASQLGSIPRQIEGVQFGAIQAALIPPEFFVGVDRPFRSDGRARPCRHDGARPARRRRPGGTEADARTRGQQGLARGRAFHGNPVLDYFENADPPSRRFQGQEDPDLRVAIPKRGVRTAGRNAGGNDAGRRVAGAAAGRHRRRRRRAQRLRSHAFRGRGEVRHRDQSTSHLHHP